MGTPAAAVPVLDAVWTLAGESDGKLVAVYTAPDGSVGRGGQRQGSPVRRKAERLGVPVLTPERVTGDKEQERFEQLQADLVVLAAYGLLLPPTFLFGPKNGAVNIHPSLLPRHRGAAPVAGAILAGDTSTGASLIVMDEGLDTGAILAQSAVSLTGKERTQDLTERLFEMGASLLTDSLAAYVVGELAPVPQPTEGVTMTTRLSKADGEIDWREPAEIIERKVRAFDLWPGTATTWERRRLAITDVGVSDERIAGDPGVVRRFGREILVATGAGAIELRKVKMEGRTEVTIEEFVRGHERFVGARLPS